MQGRHAVGRINIPCLLDHERTNISLSSPGFVAGVEYCHCVRLARNRNCQHQLGALLFTPSKESRAVAHGVPRQEYSRLVAGLNEGLELHGVFLGRGRSPTAGGATPARMAALTS